MMVIDYAALVTRSPVAPFHSGYFGNRPSGTLIAIMRGRQVRAGQGPHHASTRRSFTKSEIAREDVLQSSEIIGHGPGRHKLQCRIPPASNVKKKQDFA
jgi:hypothetical protein